MRVLQHPVLGSLRTGAVSITPHLPRATNPCSLALWSPLLPAPWMLPGWGDVPSRSLGTDRGWGCTLCQATLPLQGPVSKAGPRETREPQDSAGEWTSGRDKGKGLYVGWDLSLDVSGGGGPAWKRGAQE